MVNADVACQTLEVASTQLCFLLESRNKALLSEDFDLIFTSSLVPICELFAFFPHLNDVPVVVYCHENQFTYPNRNHSNRDHHFAFTELISFLRATRVVFNSEFNRQSFLRNSRKFLERMPDCSLVDRLAEVEKSRRFYLYCLTNLRLCLKDKELPSRWSSGALESSMGAR